MSYKTLDNIEKIYDAAKHEPQRYGSLMDELDGGRIKPPQSF